MYTYFKKRHLEPKLKFPINDIKIDKNLLDFPNEVDKSKVSYMLINFDKDAREPMTIDKNFNLIDGQHRLSLANQMELEFIDVVIEDTELLQN